LLERERLTQFRLHALETLALRLVDVGRHAEAFEFAYAAVSADPLRERAHVALISAYVAQGNGVAAAQYQRYADVVRRQLRIEPSSKPATLIEGRSIVSIP
jgi:DNA-binding SARP family transcriptional activator